MRLWFWFLVCLFLFVALPVLAQDAAPVDPIVGFLTGILGAGFVAKWGVLIVAAVALLRAAAATISKHVPDESLGSLAVVVNWLGGNTKNATNAAAPSG